MDTTQEAAMDPLYKYMPFETARIVLTNGTLRWTTPPLLNDPFDISFDLLLDVDPKEVRRLALDLLWADWLDDSRPAPQPAFEAWKQSLKDPARPLSREAFDKAAGLIVAAAIKRTESITEMNAELQGHLRQSKLLCLTESPDNMLMWAHYGQQHYGAVLAFTPHGETSLFAAARPVIYTDKMPRFTDNPGLAGIIAGRPVDAKALTQAQIYTKARDWSYEREWRIQFGKGRDSIAPHQDLKFGDELLTGVVMGCRMSPENRLELAALARALNPDVELFAARPTAREFRMELEPFAAT